MFWSHENSTPSPLPLRERGRVVDRAGLAPVRVPGQRPLALSVMSVTSVANDKGDNKMIPGAVHRSPGLCLMSEENLS